jgi:Recombinase
MAVGAEAPPAVCPPRFMQMLLSANQVAHELNRRGIATPKGGRWHAATVTRLRRRLNEGGQASEIEHGV